jgi:hypothetical protein
MSCRITVHLLTLPYNPLPLVPLFPFPPHLSHRLVLRPISLSHSYLLITPDCEPALLLSALSSEDSGTLNMLPALWTVPQDIIQAGFNKPGLNTQDLGKDIPEVGTGAIIGSFECRNRCGLMHGKE